MSKVCTQCGLTKPLDSFRLITKRNKRMAECSECEKQRLRAYRAKTRKVRLTREKAVDKMVELMLDHDTGLITEALHKLQEIKNEQN